VIEELSDPRTDVKQPSAALMTQDNPEASLPQSISRWLSREPTVVLTLA